MSDETARRPWWHDYAGPAAAAVIVLLPTLAINHGSDRAGEAAATGPRAEAPMAPMAPMAPSPSVAGAAAEPPAVGAAPPAPAVTTTPRKAAAAPRGGLIGRAGPAAVAALERDGYGVVVQWRTEPGHRAADYCTVIAQQPAGSQMVIEVLLDSMSSPAATRCRTQTRPTR